MHHTDRQFTRTDTQMVKGLAITIMIIHHSFLNPERYQGQIVWFAPFSEHSFNWIANAFKICVAIFTFLSAYGITQSFKNQYPDFRYQGEGAGRLVGKRLISLLGGFDFVFLLVLLYGELFLRSGRFAERYGGGLRGILHFLIDGAGLAELFSTPTYLATFWYMSLAVVLIILMPLLLKLYRSIGAAAFLGCTVLFRVLFPVTSEQHFVYLPNYLFCIGLGIVASDQDLIVRIAHLKLNKRHTINQTMKLVLGMMLLAVLLFVRQKTRKTALLPVMDGLIPLLICVLMYAYFNRIPVLRSILDILGKYSMDIFLFHNFVRVVWYYDFTYGFHYWWLITIILLGISLVVAILMEQLKKFLRYDRLLKTLREKL